MELSVKLGVKLNEGIDKPAAAPDDRSLHPLARPATHARVANACTDMPSSRRRSATGWLPSSSATPRPPRLIRS